MKKLIVLISTMALLLSSSFTVFAEELPHGNVGAAQVEQLLEVDVVNGTERIINLPEMAAYSMIADTASSDVALGRSIIGGSDERTKITNTTSSPSMG